MKFPGRGRQRDSSADLRFSGRKVTYFHQKLTKPHMPMRIRRLGDNRLSLHRNSFGISTLHGQQSSQSFVILAIPKLRVRCITYTTLHAHRISRTYE
jgi:hypothetical protein